VKDPVLVRVLLAVRVPVPPPVNVVVSVPLPVKDPVLVRVLLAVRVPVPPPVNVVVSVPLPVKDPVLVLVLLLVRVLLPVSEPLFVKVDVSVPVFPAAAVFPPVSVFPATPGLPAAPAGPLVEPPFSPPLDPLSLGAGKPPSDEQPPIEIPTSNAPTAQIDKPCLGFICNLPGWNRLFTVEHLPEPEGTPQCP
jgi:hypothetical protein